MGAASPIIVPFLIAKNRRFKKNLKHAVELNKDRIRRAEPFDLPELNFLELTVMVEEKTEKGFLGDAGVSYLFRSDQGSLLYDVGFGPERPALAHNAAKLGIKLDQIDSLCISHLQTVLGTGKPVWQRITDNDLNSTITALNKFNPCKVFLSGHDSCDHSLTRMKHELKAETEVLRAGKTYRF